MQCKISSSTEYLLQSPQTEFKYLRQNINKFKDDYMVLVDNYGVSISVKAHEMFFHVAPWLKKWNIPLGVVSAHTEESLHSYFFKFAERKRLQNPKSPHFAENFRKVVVAENSTAI